MSAWRGAVALCGIAVLLSITVELLLHIWAWLLTGAFVALVVGIGSWWRKRRRW